MGERQERVIVDTRINLGPDFCNKIGTQLPFAS
jgi:hypothetical protein